MIDDVKVKSFWVAAYKAARMRLQGIDAESVHIYFHRLTGKYIASMETFVGSNYVEYCFQCDGVLGREYVVDVFEQSELFADDMSDCAARSHVSGGDIDARYDIIRCVVSHDKWIMLSNMALTKKAKEIANDLTRIFQSDIRQTVIAERFSDNL